ncbi:MAG: bile acid:sodium symporter family protein [Myxococcota bacterium]
MQQTFLARVVLPLALFLIMLGMGLSLVPEDFRRVLRAPRAAVVGIACQMLLLPLVGLSVVHLVEMDEPALAVGLMVLTFCPGGTTSNMLTFLARGDVALSISLTAVVSLVSPFTIPVLTAASMNHLMQRTQAIDVPVGKTIVALLVVTVIPVAVGMALRHRWPAAAMRADKPVKVMSMVFLLGIVAALIKQNAAEIPGFFAQVGAATLLLNVFCMTAGFGIARLCGLEHRQQITIGMEVGIQNGTTALLVTGTLLGDLMMTVAPAIYSLIMFATGGLFGWLVQRLAPPTRATP